MRTNRAVPNEHGSWNRYGESGDRYNRRFLTAFLLAVKHSVISSPHVCNSDSTSRSDFAVEFDVQRAFFLAAAHWHKFLSVLIMSCQTKQPSSSWRVNVLTFDGKSDINEKAPYPTGIFAVHRN